MFSLVLINNNCDFLLEKNEYTNHFKILSISFSVEVATMNGTVTKSVKEVIGSTIKIFASRPRKTSNQQQLKLDY